MYKPKMTFGNSGNDIVFELPAKRPRARIRRISLLNNHTLISKYMLQVVAGGCRAPSVRALCLFGIGQVTTLVRYISWLTEPSNRYLLHPLTTLRYCMCL